jgi:signal transduction histidine kinase
MLRYLTTVQEELREVNTDLDGKVDELAQVNLRLYEMNHLKDEFLATMSHELRTPLNSILGFSDVLTGADNLSPKQQRYLQNIQTSGRDLMALINDLLDVAKIESGKKEIQCVEFPLSDCIDRQVAGVQPMADKKNINLSTEISRDIPKLRQDPGKLQQILNNLLTNAIKFTPEGGRVRVLAMLEEQSPPAKDGKPVEPYFRLIVEDTGIGIPLEDQATIFEKFRQGKTIPGQRDTMTREYGGTGLGLSIVKELAKLLGGEVSLESEFGKGSAFRVRLPVHWDAVEHLNALGQLNAQALELAPPKTLKHQAPDPPEADESAA